MGQTIERYVVGGAVRDVLLGRKPKDIDYVWTGARPDEMKIFGLRQVGADFPVFLDEYGNEHALARTERKVGTGYNGFETTFDPTVTLFDDLQRRDLTINSLAVDLEDWDNFVVTRDLSLVIDYFDGVDHLLNKKMLLHVSPAFAEDPLRVLRVARFNARFGPVWSIADDTMELMEHLVDVGEVDNLTKERVWQEMSKAIMEDHPELFFSVLEECGAEERALQYSHRSSDTDIQLNLPKLALSAKLMMEEWQRWVALLGFSKLYKVKLLTDNWKMPKDLQKRVTMAADVTELIWLDPEEDITAKANNIFRKFRLNQPNNISQFIEVIHTMILVGNIGTVNAGKTIIQAMKKAAEVTPSSPNLIGKEIGEDLDRQRLDVFSKYSL